MVQVAKVAVKAVAKAVAKAGGDSVRRLYSRSQLVCAALGVHLCFLSCLGCPLTVVVCAAAAVAHACRRGITLAGATCGERWAKAMGETV